METTFVFLYLTCFEDLPNT
ncbi:jg4528, partial [Pararge aegeria aegeria]